MLRSIQDIIGVNGGGNGGEVSGRHHGDVFIMLHFVDLTAPRPKITNRRIREHAASPLHHTLVSTSEPRLFPRIEVPIEVPRVKTAAM